MDPTSLLSDLRHAGAGDSLTIWERTYVVVRVGQSSAPDGFETREFTMGRNEDFYLVAEGDLASDDLARCRFVMTHELNPSEVRCPSDLGAGPVATVALARSSQPPAEVVYQGKRYRFAKRTDAHYTSPARQCSRVTWDFERPGRNLAIELWPGGEMAVYEGPIVPPDRIVVRTGHRAPAGQPAETYLPAELGVGLGIISTLIGAYLLFS